MDKELNSLISKYKCSLEKLVSVSDTEIVDSSQKADADHQSNTSNDNAKKGRFEKNNIGEEKLLKVVAEVNAAKLSVQLYIDNTIWRLFSRTELQNNTLLFNNDQNRISDKKCLMRLISTLFEIDKNEQSSTEESTAVEQDQDDFLVQLHEWMLNIINLYLRICSPIEKKKILQLLITTRHISSWAIPLIQFGIQDIARIDNYIEILDTIFFNDKPDQEWTWTEDDFLSVLDQLAIDFNYDKLLESVESDEDPKTVFKFSEKIATSLMGAIRRFAASTMGNLNKRLSQILVQISVLLVDSVAEKDWKCQDQIDAFITRIVYGFYDLRKSGWFFLPSIPFKNLSVNTLWDITIHLLQIKRTTDTRPVTINDVLDDHLPNITRFQYELRDNEMQSFFMLSCLTSIAICIPSGVDHISSLNDPEAVLSTCIIIVISYTLFTVAFVDKELREIFYKDVRDSLSLICQHHSFIVSLLFRWTVQHIDVMERMALYLFHSIRLEQWVILHDDLKLLHKLLSPTNTTSKPSTVRIQFAKYIIEHLNYEYKPFTVDTNLSKSQPWRSRKIPALPYEIHEEIAFILLDACQQFQPLPDTDAKKNENKNSIELVSTVASAVSTYLPISDQIQLLKSVYIAPSNSANQPFVNGHSKENTNAKNNYYSSVLHFIDWAWSIAIRLKLYDSPVSSRTSDIEESITLPFLKLVLNSYNHVSALHSALLIYISFMLSATSRHFLRFEAKHGWMKLLVILKRGKAEAILQIFSEIVPSFVYMHGDDFFNDESLSDFLQHMIELKTDPLLNKALKHQALRTDKHQQKLIFEEETLTGVGFIIGSHVWHAQVIDSVSNLLDDDGKGFSYVDLMLHSWFKTVFHRTDWIWQNAYVSLVDMLCKLTLTLGRRHLVDYMLIEEQKRVEAAKLQSATSSPRLTRLIKNMIPISDGSFPTLLVGEWSLLLNLKASTFNKQPGVEERLYWFAYEVLVMETSTEAPLRDEITQVVTQQLSRSLASDQVQQKEHEKEQRTALDLLAVYKQIPSSNKKPIEFFAVYRWLQHILNMPVDHPLLPLYCQMFLCLYYQCIDPKHKVSLGYLFFNKKPEMVAKLRDFVATAQTHFGQKMTTLNSTHNVNNSTLQQFYYAMWLWLGNEDIVDLNVDIGSLSSSQYDTHRLELCYARQESQQPWHHSENFWMDLVNAKRPLEHDFLTFPWEGSEKFVASNDNDTVQSAADDALSMATTTATRRRLRLITDKSIIEPLPPIVINEPIMSPSTSSGSAKSIKRRSYMS